MTEPTDSTYRFPLRRRLRWVVGSAFDWVVEHGPSLIVWVGGITNLVCWGSLL